MESNVQTQNKFYPVRDYEIKNKAQKEQISNGVYWVYLIGFFLILALPLLNLPPWFSPPDWGKTIIFRTVLSVLIFLFVCQILFKKESFSVVQRTVQRISAAKTSFYLLIALLGIYLLATIFSQDIYFSLWGNPYRSGGFVNFAFYIILALLMFLILRKKDWQRIWNFAILIGILVSIIAIFQWQGLLKEFLITFEKRPPSTIGGPIFLATYLLFLVFITFSLLLKEKEIKKKLFYLLALLLFLYVIFITGSRAAYFGLLIGFFYFILCYPKKNRLVILLKTLFLLLLIVGAYGVYYVNTQSKLPSYLQENKMLQQILPRLSIGLSLEDPRFSAWLVSIEAIKERPLLGWGPENFSIAFDKHYDPSLPFITKDWGSWWDRAHNFLFDISVTAGLPALIIFIALFAVLFWKLQKVKEKRDENSLISQGIQASFFGYLASNLFSFDTFSSYLISFLLISYSLSLIHQSENPTIVEKPHQTKKCPIGRFLQGHRYFFISVLFLCLIWFVWQYNIKPFKINTQINIAKYLVIDKKCEQSFKRLDNILAKKSFLNNYLRLKYIDYLRACEAQHPEKTYDYAQKGAKLLKENVAIQPYNVRNWILLAGFMNVLIDKEQNQQNWEKLVTDTKSYLEKAEELSPKRQEVFIEWAKFGLVANNFQIMKEKSQKCIEVNPNLADCYWFKGLAEIFLGELENGKKNLKMAEERRYNSISLISLTQLVKAHTIAKNYQELVEVYQKLISLKPEEPQYHATLAFVYKELRDYKKAREEAMKVLELQPEAREMVDEFLKSLK